MRDWIGLRTPGVRLWLKITRPLTRISIRRRLSAVLANNGIPSPANGADQQRLDEMQGRCLRQVVLGAER